MDLEVERVGRAVLDAAFHVHSVLGPGLLESVHQAALALELHERGFQVERQVPVRVDYEGTCLDVGFRADLIVEGKVLVELKSVEAVTPLFKKGTTNDLKRIALKLGFLMNFNEPRLQDGIPRGVHSLEGKPSLGKPSPSSPASRDSTP